MLTGLLGTRLLLLIGKTVPLPASAELMTAFVRAEVTQDVDAGDGFQLTFTIGKDKTFDYNLVRSSDLEPFNRVIVTMILGAIPTVLIDGVITHQQMNPGQQPGTSTLTITGKDIGTMLDLKEKNEQYANQPDSVIALRIIGNYAQYGLIPVVTPTTDIPIELDRIPRQHETDLQCLRELARRNGFVFYIEPRLPGVSTAYWGRENRLGLPQSALSIDLGSMSNLKSLHFSNDGLAPEGAQATIVEPITKTAIPIPPLPSLRLPPLSSSPVAVSRSKLLRNTAQQNPASAATSLIAAATNAPEAVRAEGEVDSVRYGGVVKARSLAGVRGAGRSFDGIYYVRKVTHSIQRGEYTQRFVLSREGKGTLTPVVRP